MIDVSISGVSELLETLDMGSALLERSKMDVKDIDPVVESLNDVLLHWLYVQFVPNLTLGTCTACSAPVQVRALIQGYCVCGSDLLMMNERKVG